MNIHRFVFLGLLLISILSSYGNGDFRHLSHKDGLSSNRTYQSVQDKEGFIWISTDAGIDRFDGSRIVHYDLEMHDEISSRGYQFISLLIDNQNQIFVVSNRGYVFKLNRLSDRFERLKDFESLYGRYVFSAIVDSRRHLMLVTPTGLIVYNYDTMEFYEPLIPKAIHSIMQFGDGYLLGMTNGITKLSKDFKTEGFLGKWDEHLGSHIQIRSLHHDTINKRIWFGTQNVGLYYFDLQSDKYYESYLNEQMQKFPVWDIAQANDTLLLIGTDGAGMFVMDLKHLNIINQYTHDEDNEYSISSNVIHGILVSNSSLYFIMTDLGGVNILSTLKPGFNIIKRKKGNPNSIINNVIHSIVEITPGIIAFGTDRGVSLWNRSQDTFNHIGNDFIKGRNNVVTSMTRSADESLWIGYFLGETEVYGGPNQYKNLPYDIKHSRNPKSMYFDDERNTLWMGCTKQQIKLLSFNFTTLTFNRFPIQEVSDLASYPYGKILAGTHSGLYIIDKNNFDYQLYNKLEGKLNRISSIHVDSKLQIWLGSDGGGLVKIDLADNSQLIFNETNGLASNNIYTIEEDDSGWIWVATESGLSRINPETSVIMNYFESDGIASGDFKYNASCKTSDGAILVGGTGGATLFDPSKFSEPDTSLNLVFTDLYVNQKKIVGDGSILEAPLNTIDKINLQYNENSFSIEFTNIDFMHPEQARYSWKLEGFDEEWTSPSSTVKSVYTNIKPGNYIFRVRLKPYIMSGITPLERTIKININPPFWKSLLAFFIYALIITSLLLAVLYYNKLMHEARSSRDKLRYVVNLSHEMKTPLSLIRAPIGDLIHENRNESVAEKLNTAMANVEKLQKKIDQFLDFKRIRQIKNIHLEKIEAIAFIKKKILDFNLLAERHNLQLNMESSLHEVDVYCDPELLDKILNNLLSNAIKYNKPGGFVNVRLTTEKTSWTLTVTDSGIGIPQKEQKKIFSLFFRASNASKSQKSGSGVGLVLVQDMVNVLKGTMDFKSTEGQGSIFSLTFPIGEPDIHDLTCQQGRTVLDKKDIRISEAKDDQFKILIVEDDQELRSYIKKILEETYLIIECTNGQQGLAFLQQELPDLVLSDVAMPQMNGRQLCLNIKSNPSTSHIPVILLSGLDSKSQIIKGLAAGADDYITKPFDSSILMAKIEGLINNRKILKKKFLNDDREAFNINIKNNYDKKFLERITRLVEENLSDVELSVRLLYTTVGMSRTAFYHKLKSLIDLSPAEFIRSVRLNQAKVLLRSNRYNINEVAYRCGFSDAKYFSTSFKRQFGKSPSAYMTDHQI